MKNLSKLKDQYEKLGQEIKNLEDLSEKWYKVFAPKWKEGNITTAYSIMYIVDYELSKLEDYTILETYSSKEVMLNRVKKNRITFS